VVVNQKRPGPQEVGQNAVTVNHSRMTEIVISFSANARSKAISESMPAVPNTPPAHSILAPGPAPSHSRYARQGYAAEPVIKRRRGAALSPAAVNRQSNTYNVDISHTASSVMCQLTDLVYDGVFEVLQWLLFLSAVPPVQLLTAWCVTAKALPDISAISALTAVKHGNYSSLTPLLNPVRTRKSLIWP
jgi:hypothetical protein